MTKALIAPTLLAVMLWTLPAAAQNRDDVDHAGTPTPPLVDPVAPVTARPFVLERGSKPATSLFTRTSVHLGDVPVFKNESHAVKLRFTLSGTPPPVQWAPAFASPPPAPTLFTIHVDVVGLP